MEQKLIKGSSKLPHYTNVVYKRAGKLIRNQVRFQMEFQAGWVVS